MQIKPSHYNCNLCVQNLPFYFHDLELDPMTLVLKFDLDMVVTYQYTKYEVNRSICSKVIVWKERHTDIQTQTDRQTHRQTCVKPTCSHER